MNVSSYNAQEYPINYLVPQMFAVKAQEGKEKLDKSLHVRMSCVIQICSLLEEERRRELKGRKRLKNLQKKKLPGMKQLSPTDFTFIALRRNYGVRLGYQCGLARKFEVEETGQLYDERFVTVFHIVSVYSSREINL